MTNLPTTTSISLELTISMTCLASSPSLPDASTSSENVSMRDLFDINQPPSSSMLLEQEEDQDQEEEERWGHDHQESIDNHSSNYKKLRLTKEQSRLLEECFGQKHTLNPKQKESLAYQLKLKPRQVEVWFQNRRARTKLKQTEMACEYLKRCFGSLTEENKKPQKELEQLRAMRVISRDQPQPTSTITICPHCERVITTNSSDATCIR